MGLLQHNLQPISLNNGAVFLDGVRVMDSIRCEISFTPEVWSGKQLGDRTNSSRWLGYNISGSITRRRTTAWLKDLIKGYIRSGRTPEFTITGRVNDPGSDYGARFGSDTVTAVGVIFTGDLPLINLDADSNDVLNETISFTARNIV